MMSNDDCDVLRGQVLAMDPLPYVNRANYIIQQIEERKKITNLVVESTAFIAKITKKITMQI